MVKNRKAKIHGLASRYAMATHARVIWREHPYVRDITELTFARFGYVSLDEGKNILVAEAIRDGVLAYRSAVRNEGQDIAPASYLRAFFERMSLILTYEIRIGGVRWQPLKHSFTDMVGEISVSEVKQKWPSKTTTPLHAMLLSFMDEPASRIVLNCDVKKVENAH